MECGGYVVWTNDPDDARLGFTSQNLSLEPALSNVCHSTEVMLDRKLDMETLKSDSVHLFVLYGV